MKLALRIVGRKSCTYGSRNAGLVQLVTRLALVADAGEKVEVPFETVITYGPPGGRPAQLVVH